MKVFPGHKARFNTLIEMLKCVNDDHVNISESTTCNNQIKKRPKTMNQNTRISSNSRIDKNRDIISRNNIRDKPILDLNMKILKRNSSQSKDIKKSTNQKNLDKNIEDLNNDLHQKNKLIESLEFSNKNLFLEMNKLRKELEF